MSRINRGIPFLSILALFGCASGSITMREGVPANTGAPPTKRDKPAALYVGRFDASKGTWATKDPQQQAAKAKEVEATIREGLLERLPAIAPTRLYDSSQKSGWLITGETVHVDPGSAALRALVAHGAGQSKIRVTVRIFDLTHSMSSPIATFEVYADSGTGVLEPGGVPVMATNDTRRNIARVCREIRDEIKLLIR